MTWGGAEAENFAADYLCRQGLKLLARNYRCRQGEIDLVMDDRGTLVFVEVRLRSNPRFGGPAESITAAKQRRLRDAARHYISALGRLPPCRFDAFLLRGRDASQVDWIRNAMEL